VFVDSVFELLGVVPTKTRYSVAPFAPDHVNVTVVPAMEATARLPGALGAVQDGCGPGFEPGDEEDGPVGDDGSLSLLPHAIVAAAAMAMKNSPARFILALLRRQAGL